MRDEMVDKKEAQERSVWDSSIENVSAREERKNKSLDVIT
jgi:hypothetical protein